MPTVSRPSGIHRLASLSLLALLLGACAGERDGARKAIADIAVAVTAASPDAAKFAPAELDVVRAHLAALQASYDQGDYAAVLRGAPPVLHEAAGLLDAAAQKRAEVERKLNASWASLSASVPADLAAVRRRIDEFGSASQRRAGQRGAPHIDAAAARKSLGEAASLWSKATGAFANGNMEQAVSTAQAVEERLTALAGTLAMDLPPPPAR